MRDLREEVETRNLLGLIEDRCLTLEAIRACEDADEMQAAIDALDRNIRTMQDQLEYRSDDGADQDWERRTIGALGLHRSLHSECIRRHNHLSGRTAKNQQANADQRLAKQIKRQNHIEQQRINLESRALKTEAAKVASVDSAIRALNSTRFHRNFYRVAQKTLPPEVMAEIQSEADALTDRSVLKAMKDAGLDALAQSLEAKNEQH